MLEGLIVSQSFPRASPLYNTKCMWLVDMWLKEARNQHQILTFGVVSPQIRPRIYWILKIAYAGELRLGVNTSSVCCQIATRRDRKLVSLFEIGYCQTR